MVKRTTHRSVSGKKLYIHAFKRSHGQDVELDALATQDSRTLAPDSRRLGRIGISRTSKNHTKVSQGGDTEGASRVFIGDFAVALGARKAAPKTSL